MGFWGSFSPPARTRKFLIPILFAARTLSSDQPQYRLQMFFSRGEPPGYSTKGFFIQPLDFVSGFFLVLVFGLEFREFVENWPPVLDLSADSARFAFDENIQNPKR